MEIVSSLTGVENITLNFNPSSLFDANGYKAISMNSTSRVQYLPIQ